MVRRAGLTKNRKAEMPLALYHQIYVMLRERILEGVYAAGEMLPSEPALCRIFKVSRVTIRATLEKLEREGLILRRMGRGTFAMPDSAARPIKASIRGLMDNLLSLGLRTKAKILEFGLVPVTASVAGHLSLPLDARVQRTVRLCSYKGTPFSYAINYVPEDLGRTYTRRELSTKPFLSLLERAGLKVASADQTVTARLADANIASCLGVPVGSALISALRTVRDQKGRPVELLHTLYRPDRYEFYISISRGAGDRAFALHRHQRPARRAASTGST